MLQHAEIKTKKDIIMRVEITEQEGRIVIHVVQRELGNWNVKQKYIGMNANSWQSISNLFFFFLVWVIHNYTRNNTKSDFSFLIILTPWLKTEKELPNLSLLPSTKKVKYQIHSCNVTLRMLFNKLGTLVLQHFKTQARVCTN